MPKRDIIVVGASAGGVEALRALFAELPAMLPATVLVVLHVPAAGHSALPRILGRAGALPASHAVDGEALLPGHIYVAPPDMHLLVTGDAAVVARGPRENGHRPSVDVLFRSAALAQGPRVIGVVLSGALDDGTAGLRTIATRGGTTLVQDPKDALYPGMPTNALAGGRPDFVGTTKELATELVRLAGSDTAGRGAQVNRDIKLEDSMAQLEPATVADPEGPGAPAGYSCPDCEGTLFEVGDGAQLRFRCRVGHAWTALSLLAEQDATLEHALWMALRSLEEKAALARRMATAARDRGSSYTAQSYDQAAGEALGATGVLRDLLLSQPPETLALIEDVPPLEPVPSAGPMKSDV